ncbi:speckle-type POZ protein-like [Uloborus diversus]|uniref:speckle-type POZ protein-like n=1 Tax=Uloborus diversus TaxID=327109 RepID=UPI002409F649|nr:speckle-type POZ protein-like [Uloborus diversus]
MKVLHNIAISNTSINTCFLENIFKMNLESGIEAQDCIYVISTSKFQATVVMTLRNFSKVCKIPNIIFKSPSFSFSNATWTVQVCPNSLKTHDAEGKVLLYVSRMSSSVPVHKLSLTIGFRDKFHEIVGERKVELKFQDATPLGVRTTLELEDVIGSNIMDILVNDNLAVYCNIKDAHTDEEALDDIQDGEHMSYCLDALCRDYENLYITGDYSDVTLRSSKEEISAHRAILGARSEVFSDIFKQNNPCTHVIDDVDSETLRNLLFYIYTGKVKELSSDSVSRLFAAAEKFAIEELKVMCKRYMKKNLSVANVCDVITLSEKYNLEDLSLLAKRFLHKHAAEVVESKEWSYFEVECPDLALTLLRSFVREHKTGEENKPAASSENSDATRPPPRNSKDSNAVTSSTSFRRICIFLTYLIFVYLFCYFASFCI